MGSRASLNVANLGTSLNYVDPKGATLRTESQNSRQRPGPLLECDLQFWGQRSTKDQFSD